MDRKTALVEAGMDYIVQIVKSFIRHPLRYLHKTTKPRKHLLSHWFMMTARLICLRLLRILTEGTS